MHVPKPLDADLRGAMWFPPMFVVEVFIRGIGNSGVLRQPSLKAVRLDKDVGDLVGFGSRRRRARSKARREDRPTATSRQNHVAAATAARAAPPMRLTSPTKIIFPDSHITKQQVADYYLAVMDRLLPEIAGRPLSIIRCPDGAGKACFFQKHHTPGLEHVGLVRLKEEGGNNANYLVVDDAAGVMELVQFNALEFHPWGSHADDPDLADRVVFDLDPGAERALERGQARGAARARPARSKLELKTFLRTTGGKGLHVVRAAESRQRLGRREALREGFRRSAGGIRAAALPRDVDAEAAAEQDLRRLPAQRPRRDRRGVVFAARARPARRWRCRWRGPNSRRSSAATRSP